jgi:hypothetical protein
MNVNSPIRSYQWVLIAASVGLFALWELVDHLWLARLSMHLHHGLHVLGESLYLVLIATVIFGGVWRYEQTLLRLNAELQAKNEALRQLEATVDKRLVELAQNLSLSLADLISHAQVALQRTTDLPNLKAFSECIDHAQGIYDVARELLKLEQMTAEG